MDLSEEHDAKTVGSDGDHWMSSTEEVCEEKQEDGVVLVTKDDWEGMVRWILEWMSPVRSRSDEALVLDGAEG